jgi:chain length determinant protein tyrosine kinase EpsG
MNGLTLEQVEAVRAIQSKRPINFAEAALSLGIIRRENILLALSQHYKYPILVPSIERAVSQELFAGYDAFGSESETLRSIRAALISNAIGVKTNSFAIIGPRSGVGVTYLAANLAVSFAQSAASTLLVDANLRRPRIAEMFGLGRNTRGLSDAINDRLADSLPICVDVIPGLSIMPAGAIPPNPQELLSLPEFAAMCGYLREQYGVVIYDTAASEDCADGLIVAARVGAAVMIARRHKTAFADMTRLSGALRGYHCEILGSVLDR